jgi:hypothetical protein
MKWPGAKQSLVSRFRSSIACSTGVLVVLLASTGYSQTPASNGPRQIPDFSVQIWGDTVEDFTARVSAYFDLRAKMEIGSLPITVTDDPAEIERAESDLGRRIIAARAGARRGDIFTPAIRQAFKKALISVMNEGTWAAIMDDNPGEVSHHVNHVYQKGKSFSTVPPNILALLPALPEDIHYRFLGRHLILYDTRANLIIDRMPDAIRF